MKKNNKNLILSKENKNYRDGYHLKSKYWQEWKKRLPALPLELKEIAIGMKLSDACMYKKSKSQHPLIKFKFEQGYLQEEFLLHLFTIFKPYCFMNEPGKRITLDGVRKGLTKSFWFKTFHIQPLMIFGIYFILILKIRLSKEYRKV
jgi:hypothetical protein